MSEQRLKDLYKKGLAGRHSSSEASAISPEEMLDVLENRTSGAERQRVLRAVMSDPSCRQEFELLRALVEQAPEEARRPPTRRTWPLRIAASLVLIAGVGVIWRALPDRTTASRDGGTTRLQLIAPAHGDVASSSMRFVWNAVPRALSYEYNLVTSDGRVVYGTTLSDTALVIPDSVNYGSPGLVSWWVEAMLSDGTRSRSVLRDLRVNTP